MVVDVTQMAGAAPVTMTHWGADALVCSGYKWLSAPPGVALLAVTESLAAATPVIVGWKGSATPFDFTQQELSLASGYPCTPTTAATTSTPSPTRSPPSPHARRPALSV